MFVALALPLYHRCQHNALERPPPMANPDPRQALHLLAAAPFPIRISAAFSAPTTAAIAERCRRAFAFLQDTLGFTPTFELAIRGAAAGQVIATWPTDDGD